jgi:hypothetical protein
MFVPAWNGPQTTVLHGGIFKRKPKPNDVLWFRVKESAVLMTSDFAANLWLFKDVEETLPLSVLKPILFGKFLNYMEPAAGIEPATF